MDKIELKYREKDFNKITNAFYDLYHDNQEGDCETFLPALQTLLGYPTKVIETYLKAVLALDEEFLSKEHIMAAKIYILMRMNLCEL